MPTIKLNIFYLIYQHVPSIANSYIVEPFATTTRNNPHAYIGAVGKCCILWRDVLGRVWYSKHSFLKHR
jgi:hypothetical protein